VGRYENKGAQPSAEVLSKLANALGTYMDGGIQNPERKVTVCPVV